MWTLNNIRIYVVRHRASFWNATVESSCKSIKKIHGNKLIMLNIVKNPISYSKVIKQRKRNLSIPACALCGKLRALDWFGFFLDTLIRDVTINLTTPTLKQEHTWFYGASDLYIKSMLCCLCHISVCCNVPSRESFAISITAVFTVGLFLCSSSISNESVFWLRWKALLL